MTPEDEEFEAIAKFQAKKQAEKSLGDGDCDSPSWCKHYGKCHRKTVGAPMLANCIDTAEKQEPVGHADLEINNIYLFNDQEQRVVPTGRQPIYTHPPKREWVGLTDEEIADLAPFIGMTHLDVPTLTSFIRSSEDKLKEKNT